MKQMSLRTCAIATSAFACATLLSFSWSEQRGVSLSVESAQARIGRPLTPFSVAGVARRNYRRAAYGYGAGVIGAGAIGTAAYYGGYPGSYYGSYGYPGGYYGGLRQPQLRHRPANADPTLLRWLWLLCRCRLPSQRLWRVWRLPRRLLRRLRQPQLRHRTANAVSALLWRLGLVKQHYDHRPEVVRAKLSSAAHVRAQGRICAG